MDLFLSFLINNWLLIALGILTLGLVIFLVGAIYKLIKTHGFVMVAALCIFIAGIFIPIFLPLSNDNTRLLQGVFAAWVSIGLALIIFYIQQHESDKVVEQITQSNKTYKVLTDIHSELAKSNKKFKSKQISQIINKVNSHIQELEKFQHKK